MDFYGVLALHDSSFAVPFWSAAKYVELEGAKEILDSIISDEATNCSLRVAPTMRSGNIYKPKIVLMPREDLWKIKYLEDQVVELKDADGTPPSAAAIAKVIVDNNIAGRMIFRAGTLAEHDLIVGSKWRLAVEEGRVPKLFAECLQEYLNTTSKDLDEMFIEKIDRKILDVLRTQNKKRTKKGKTPGSPFVSIYAAVKQEVSLEMFRSRFSMLFCSGKIKRHGNARTLLYTAIEA